MRPPDVGIARVRVLVEQHLCGHEDAVHAVAALRGLLLDERRLQRMWSVDRAEAVERQHVLVPDGRDRHRAGPHGVAVDNHGTGTALGEAATEARAVLVQVVAEDVEQRRGGVGIHDARHSVHFH